MDGRREGGREGGRESEEERGEGESERVKMRGMWKRGGSEG